LYTTIAFEQQEHVGYLTLQRAHKRNALNPMMRDELVDLGATLSRDVSLRCLVVQGAGPTFSAGLDLQEGLGDLFGGWGQHLTGEALIEKGIALASAFEWIPRLDVPSVAAVHGHAYGAGFQLALACDFRVLTRSALVGLVESRYGLMPDMGATFRLPRIVGDAVARRMILLGDLLDGVEAAAVGLADQVVPDDQLPETVEILARRLAAQPPLAVRGARRAMAAGRDLPDDEALRVAVTQQATCLTSDDFAELLGRRR
jgi:enoyl-CoA hydratase/carnithine racemase